MESKLEIIEDTGKSFKIAYEDVVIIDHNVKDPDNEFFPVMEIGIGSFDASEHLGNWKINDTVFQKMALDLYELGKNYKPLYPYCFINRYIDWFLSNSDQTIIHYYRSDISIKFDHIFAFF